MRLFHQVIHVVYRQKWLDPLSDTLRKVVKATFDAGGTPGKTIKNFLHGTWLGHPLHSVLIHFPIGAWTAALAFDAIDAFRGTDGLQAGADGAVVLGLVGAVGAGLTGVTDWHQSDPAGARRIGLAHGLLNLTATGLYAASLILRLEGIRGPGRGLALLGYVALVAAGFLGGHLAHALRVGVNQALEAPEEQPTPSDYVSVLAESGLGEGKLRRIEMGRIPILLTRQGDRIHALADTCSHMGCSLAKGTIENGSVVCSCHGSRFSLQDGRVLNGPAVFPQPRFATRIRDGQIEVRTTPETWTAIVSSNGSADGVRREKIPTS